MPLALAPADKYDCHLPLDPPRGAEWWRPDKDEDPGPRVRAVVRVGEDPLLRRAVRLENCAGWVEERAMVNFYKSITPPMPWEQTGVCWSEVSHPVVACEPWPL